MSRSRNAGGPVDVDPHVVGSPAPENAHARVQTQPDSKGNLTRPGMGGQLPLPLSGRSKGSFRSREDGEEGITLGSDLDAVIRSDDPAQDPFVIVLHPPIGLVTQLV